MTAIFICRKWIVQVAQKYMQTFVMFVHTECWPGAILRYVKTPQYIIYSFCYTP